MINTACPIIFEKVPDTNPDKIAIASCTYMQNGTGQRISSVIALKVKSFLEVKYNEIKEKYSLRVFFYINKLFYLNYT